MDENEMLAFVKAIADADRLRIVGLLTQKPARLSEICAVLGFHPSDAQHHLDQEENRRRILAAHLNPDGTLKQIPFQAAKLQVILDYLLNAFSVGANYTEKEVNMILAHFHPDKSGLRRDLIEAGMLERKRDGSRYWRPK